MGPRTRRIRMPQKKEDDTMKGTIPQWIAAAMLGIIITLMGLIYGSVNGRVGTLEEKHMNAMEKLIRIETKLDRLEKLLDGKESHK